MSSQRKSVGILGVGSYLPEEIRTNDWWPRHVVAKWEENAVQKAKRIEEPARDGALPGERLILEAMKKLAHDPFRGAVERRVLPERMQPSDMEYEAARLAIADARIDPKEIDAVLTYSFVPDELLCSNAFPIHQRLGLPNRCLTFGVEGACNSFLVAINLGEALIRTGQARNALVIQSTAISRILSPEDQQSAWFGDGAAATVLGSLPDGCGILGRASRTGSELHKAVVTGVPGKRWFDDGRSRFYPKDRAAAFRIMTSVADHGLEVIEAALIDANLKKSDVGFFACHQISPWMRTLVQEFVGLAHARSVETFHWVGNLASVNVPLVLDVGRREGLIRKGDVVVMYGGGAGVSYSSIVMRWGTA